jgi:hypothetical protein
MNTEISYHLTLPQLGPWNWVASELGVQVEVNSRLLRLI